MILRKKNDVVYPLRALPGVDFRDDHARGSAVFALQRLAFPILLTSILWSALLLGTTKGRGRGEDTSAFGKGMLERSVPFYETNPNSCDGKLPWIQLIVSLLRLARRRFQFGFVFRELRVLYEVDFGL